MRLRGLVAAGFAAVVLTAGCSAPGEHAPEARVPPPSTSTETVPGSATPDPSPPVQDRSRSRKVQSLIAAFERVRSAGGDCAVAATTETCASEVVELAITTANEALGDLVKVGPEALDAVDSIGDITTNERLLACKVGAGKAHCHLAVGEVNVLADAAEISLHRLLEQVS